MEELRARVSALEVQGKTHAERLIKVEGLMESLVESNQNENIKLNRIEDGLFHDHDCMKVQVALLNAAVTESKDAKRRASERLWDVLYKTAIVIAVTFGLSWVGSAAKAWLVSKGL